jgi:hypothetical protein
MVGVGDKEYEGFWSLFGDGGVEQISQIHSEWWGRYKVARSSIGGAGESYPFSGLGLRVLGSRGAGTRWLAQALVVLVSHTHSRV